jgi:uncharacterized protein YkwD
MNVLYCALIALAAISPNQVLLKTGRDLQVRSILTGKPHPVLQRAAEEHAAYQARVQVQGHQDWSKRVQVLMKALPGCTEFRECCNESWPDQNVNDAAKEMFRSWKLSPGHWSAINGKCSYYGYAMARGKNGVWYTTAIFADLR